MTKESYLNYVMLTAPKDIWPNIVFEYIQNNDIRNWKEGFDFIIKWHGGPSLISVWLLRFGYVEEIRWVTEVIENDKTGDAAWAAFQMVVNDYAKPQWAMRIIESINNIDDIDDKNKNVSCRWAADGMVKNSFATQSWYDRIGLKYDPSVFS